MATCHAVKREPDIHVPTAEEVRVHLPLLLGSTEFNTSERNKRFLTYVVDETLGGRADRIKAYNIALTVFDRAEDFDPLIDPIVRIEASRLRRSLEHYYLTAGKSDRVRIDIPKGSYAATFAYGDATPAGSPSAAKDAVPPEQRSAPPDRARPRRWRMWASALAALIMVAAGLAAYLSWRPGGGAAAGAPALSIEVVAFEYTGGDPGHAFVARGLTYYLIARLTQIDGVAVFGAEGGLGAGRARQTPARPAYALFGSVQPEANRIRVTAILADARTGRFLQSWNFERDLESLDYPGVQSDIAEQLARALQHQCAIDGQGDTSGNAEAGTCRPSTTVAAN
jgi:adenylate cyclase